MIETVKYLEDMLKELSQMARDANLMNVTYLLNIAQGEIRLERERLINLDIMDNSKSASK